MYWIGKGSIYVNYLPKFLHFAMLCVFCGLWATIKYSKILLFCQIAVLEEGLYFIYIVKPVAAHDPRGRWMANMSAI